VRAPQRDVRITSSTGGKVTLVGEFRSPLTAQRLRITDPAILEDARDGMIDMKIDISQPVGQSGTDFSAQLANWQVDYFRLNVVGRVLER
jgi:hypothetical protein